MKVFTIFISVSVLSSAFIFSLPEEREKESYAIIELVLRKEGATKVYQQADHGHFFASTDSLKKLFDITRDSSFLFDERTRVQLLEQAKASTLTKWDKRKIYHYTVVEKDKVAEVSGSVVDFKISPAYHSENGKTLSIHRISAPLFNGMDEAIVYVEFGMIGVLNDGITFSKAHQKVYVLRKNNAKWKVAEGVLIAGN
jgi:hypothetical protein